MTPEAAAALIACSALAAGLLARLYLTAAAPAAPAPTADDDLARWNRRAEWLKNNYPSIHERMNLQHGGRP